MIKKQTCDVRDVCTEVYFEKDFLALILKVHWLSAS